MQKWIFLIAMLLTSASSQAAPCCAGSNAVPSLITGDESQSLTVGIAYGKTVGDAPGAGQGLSVFRDSLSAQESRQILTLNYARLLDEDRLQAGVSVPLLFNHLQSGGHTSSAHRFGDVSMTLGYETLPEWEYSEWKPRVFSFLQFTAPTARSLYESENLLATDVGGLGQFQMAFGNIVIKRWSTWDLNALAKVARIFGRTFNGAVTGASQVSSSWGLSASLGAGYSFFDRYRVGLSLTPDYQSPVDVRSSEASSLTSQRLVWNAGFTFTYLSGLNDAFVFSLNDQTLFGPALNTSLIRTAGLAFTHRIER